MWLIFSAGADGSLMDPDGFLRALGQFPSIGASNSSVALVDLWNEEKLYYKRSFDISFSFCQLEAGELLQF